MPTPRATSTGFHSCRATPFEARRKAHTPCTKARACLYALTTRVRAASTQSLTTRVTLPTACFTAPTALPQAAFAALATTEHRPRTLLHKGLGAGGAAGARLARINVRRSGLVRISVITAL